MEQFSFIACMPDKPGALHRAAEIIQRHRGNIGRIQYDRRIDQQTVFFEVKASLGAYGKIHEELENIGYLQTSLHPVAFLKLHVLCDSPFRKKTPLSYLPARHTHGSQI